MNSLTCPRRAYLTIFTNTRMLLKEADSVLYAGELEENTQEKW
jgi:hypothetical protein